LWDYRWRWFGACCARLLRDLVPEGKKPRTGVSALQKRLRLLLRALFALFNRRLEILDALTQALAQIGQLAGPENKQCNREDQEQLHRANFSTKHNYLRGIARSAQAPL